MSKKDSKILFLDDDGQEIEFNVIEQTTRWDACPWDSHRNEALPC